MRVLVVEDETKMAVLLRRGLEREGYAVDVATDGPEALWAAEEVAFDAVVLDVMIPEPDGFEVCRRLRERGIWSPVLLLTARDSVEDLVRRGRDIERTVLARAVRWHLEDRVLLHGNRTIVFR